MSNWEKLANDPDFKEMWKEPRLAKLTAATEKQLLQDRTVSTRDRLWKQGFLAGLEFIRQFPMV